MAANSTGSRLRLLLLLLPIPLFWIAFTEAPFAQDFSKPLLNLAMDWRFRVRGPVDVPEVKIVYADIDARTISELKERPWPREQMAQIAQILFEFGGAKAIGYDIIFSMNTPSVLVDMEKFKKNDEYFGAVFDKYPGIVLAANYTGVKMPKTFEQLDMNEAREVVEQPLGEIPLAYLREENPKAYNYTPENSFPEMPSYPIWRYSRGSDGVGLIAVEQSMSAGPVPRWVPLYTKAKGPYYTLSLIKGFEVLMDLKMNEEIQLMDKEDFAMYKEFVQIPAIKELPDESTVMIYSKEGMPIGAASYITEQTFYHFSIELALRYLGLTHENIEITEDRLIIRLNDGTVFREIPMTNGQISEINWFSPWRDYELNPRESVDKIFIHANNLLYDPTVEGAAKIDISDEELAQLKEDAKTFFKKFNDAIVLIGPVDPILQDLAPTPFDAAAEPKVGVHGNMLKTIFSGKFINRLLWWQHAVITLALTYIVAALGTYTGKYNVWMKLASAMVLCGYVFLVFGVFSTFHLVIPFIAPVASAVTTTLAGAVYQLIVEEKQRGRIKGMFGAYLSPDLVNSMVESGEEPTLGGEEVEITAFFSDIQGFSTFSELLTADRLVALMNEYLTAMTDILQEELGTLDKYIGDAMVAMFNAPIHVENHALRGCLAAARIQKRQLELRKKWESEGDDWPSVVGKMQTRIGLNTGPAVVGNMGSENRFNYTMMGDTVNLAARSESGAKSYGVYIMVTGETRSACMAVSDACVFRYLDKIRVKGRSQPAEMYELVCTREDLDDDTAKCLEIYQQGIECYLKQDFNGAIEFFEQSVELEPNRPEKNTEAPTTPSDVLLARCLYYIEEPPGANWDGVFVMKSK
ncbi:adenylate/guanylate cyclase domain-containing protein [Cerasicoccus arenae]|uniref:Guanylate cyclase n=1 Tax=Cerasicoccus arenae TaxID=424488 RepID=A0A8J3DF82_9BACT|nr:adenylate/guanylate cyclase domain-containing protein [Cerasicoccus arenae]MBK1859319.1 adenylate/guanylate cyclase domain-containing protein [Cerasicoccus arenae]GHB93957.1 guanylate cyclase [Cerasicoccus arenae]